MSYMYVSFLRALYNLYVYVNSFNVEQVPPFLKNVAWGKPNTFLGTLKTLGALCKPLTYIIRIKQKTLVVITSDRTQL